MKYFALLLCCATIGHAADAPEKKPTIGNLSVTKVLFLGNSITFHGAKPEIGWTGEWGMAASAEHLDYVHLLAADIAKEAKANPRIMARNIADFERGYATYNIPEELEKELAFQPDLIIVAIGENVPELVSPEAKESYAESFRRLLNSLKMQGHPAIFVRGTYWPMAAKDEIMRTVSTEVGATFVDIHELGGNSENAASSERQFEHAGVAAHPGDRGMRAIADKLFIEIKKNASQQTGE